MDLVLILAHDQEGHNGFPRTYATIRRPYYWKGMKKTILRYCRQCKACVKINLEIVKYEKQNFRSARHPMQFISMHFIGEFHLPSSIGHRYVLTAICMLTHYTFCIPLHSKKAEEVIQAYMDKVYCQFGRSQKILCDNGTEFKNQLFEDVVKQLGVEYKIYTPSHRLQLNGRIKSFHRFLKICSSKV